MKGIGQGWFGEGGDGWERDGERRDDRIHRFLNMDTPMVFTT